MVFFPYFLILDLTIEQQKFIGLQVETKNETQMRSVKAKVKVNLLHYFFGRLRYLFSTSNPITGAFLQVLILYHFFLQREHIIFLSCHDSLPSSCIVMWIFTQSCMLPFLSTLAHSQLQYM